MASMALQISQMNATLQGGLQGFLNGTLTPQQNVAFQALMAGLLQGQSTQKATPSILPDGTTATVQTQAQFTMDDLKALSPQALQTLIAQMLSQKTTATPLISDALSGTSPLSTDTSKNDVYAIIDDPDMAAALLGFLNSAQATQTSVTKAAGLRQSIANQFIVTTEKEVDLAALAPQPTLTLPADGDSFQAVKKLAFADLAPFLTKPRTVRIDSHQVAEIAQGPSFLQSSLTLTDFAAATGLAPTLTPQITDAQIKALVTAQTQGQPVIQTPTAALQASVSVSKAATTVANAPVIPNSKLSLSNPLWLAGLRTQGTATPDSGDGQSTAATGKPKDAALPTAQNATTALQTNPLLQATTKTPAQLLAAGLVPNPASTAQIQVMPSNSATRGFELAASKTDSTNIDGSSFSLIQGSELGLKVQADGLQTAGFSNSLMASSRATHLHPSTQLVSVALQKAAQQGDVPGEQAFTIQLDPPQLGRLRIVMQIAQDKSVKASLMAERPETLSLLQRDAQALERTLNAAGLDVSSRDGLQFTLGDSGNFDQSKGGQYQGGQGSTPQQGQDTASGIDIQSAMTWFIDPITGQQHVNMMV